MAADPRQIQRVFLAAVEKQSPAERTAVLDRQCGDNSELRERVEALLRAHDEPDQLLGRPPVAEIELAQPTTTAGLAIAAGMRVGPYKLLQKLGEGGMGTV